MNQLLKEAFEKASQLREEDQERLARLLLEEMESEKQRQGLDALSRDSRELAIPNGQQTDISEDKRDRATSKALRAAARGILAVTDFAILQFMRTRAGERTIQPTKRRGYPASTTVAD